jgi:hypothetical protein
MLFVRCAFRWGSSIHNSVGTVFQVIKADQSRGIFIRDIVMKGDSTIHRTMASGSVVHQEELRDFTEGIFSRCCYAIFQADYTCPTALSRFKKAKMRSGCTS